MTRKLILLIPILLSACGGDVKETLGLNREAPDEFAVERRPKLEIPPEFKIRPPSETQREQYITDTSAEAKAAIFGGSGGGAASSSSSFIDNFGVDEANAEIKKVLREEQGSEDPDFLDRIRSISDETNYETIVDPVAERERISENIKEGKPVTEGEVQTKSKSSGLSVIDKLLGEQ